jgi:hypothetical protein
MNFTKKACLIGINYKGSECELKGCLNDNYNIEHLLEQRYGFSKTNIRLLRDDGKCTPPTKNNILEAIDWLVKDAKSGDTLVFAYFRVRI